MPRYEFAGYWIWAQSEVHSPIAPEGTFPVSLLAALIGSKTTSLSDRLFSTETSLGDVRQFKSRKINAA
jgi:hypothetical protein